MRPLAIQSVPGLDPEATPFGRLKGLARMIVAVSKSEPEKEIKKAGVPPKRELGREEKEVRDVYYCHNLI